MRVAVETSRSAGRSAPQPTLALRDAMTRGTDRFDQGPDAVALSWTGSAQLSDRLKQALGAK